MSNVIQFADIISKINGDVTICANCKHYVRRGAVWYDQFCGSESTRLHEGQDIVTGTRGYVTLNDFGHTLIQENPMPYARDINDGRCQFYQRS